jgi:hypothetical protein
MRDLELLPKKLEKLHWGINLILHIHNKKLKIEYIVNNQMLL